MTTQKYNPDKQNIDSKIYDDRHKWKSDLWILKWVALLVIIIDFYWINKHPVFKIDAINLLVLLFFIYTLRVTVFFRNKLSFKIQMFYLIFDFLIFASFDCLSLTLFADSSRMYVLYLIPVIYCSYWFKWGFALIFVSLISFTYFILNYSILLADEIGFIIISEIKSKLVPVIALYFIVTFLVIFFKRITLKYLLDIDQELKNRAEKLEQVKQSTQTLLKDKIDGFIAIDENGKITEANQLARELLGYSEKEMYKINAKKIYSPGEASKIMTLLRQSPEGAIYNFKTLLHSKEKEKIPILLSASFLCDRDSNLQAMLSKGKKFPSIGYFRDTRADDIFADITRELASIMNEKVLLDKIVEKVSATIKSETCDVFIYNEHSGLIECISSIGIPMRLKGRRGIESYAEQEGETGYVFSFGKTRNISNIDVKKEGPKNSKIKWSTARRFAQHSRYGDLKHFLGTPLRIQGEIYGVIRVLNKYKTDNELDKQGFTNKDVLLLERISHQVSILLEKVINKERFEAISKVGMELNAKVGVPLDDLLTIIASGVVKGMKFKSCSLRLIEDGNKLKIKAYYGLRREYEDEKFTLKIGESISGKVVKTGEMKIIEDVKNEKDYKFKELLKEGLKSMLSIPLKHHNKVIGIINCYTGKKHRFTDQEIRIMETFAVYAGVAIQNKKRMDELLALNEIGSELVKPFQLEKLFDHILEKAKEISGADRLCIKRYDERTSDISTLSSCDCQWHKQTKHCVFKLGDDFISEVIRKGEPKIIPNYDISMEKLDNVSNKELFADTKSCMIAPIKIYGRVFGVLCLESKRGNYFNENDLLILNTFSNQVAAAVRNADFFKKLHDVRETFPRISELSMDIHKVLEKIVNTAAEVLETDILVLYRYDERTKKFILPPIYTGDIKYKEAFESDTIFLEVPHLIIKGKKSHFADHSQDDPVMTSQKKELKEGAIFVKREEIVSSAGFILRVGKEIEGVMFLNYRTPHEFNADERQLIEIFASYIAIAIQNVKHFSEKKAADVMQTIGIITSSFAHKLKNDIGTLTIYTSHLMGEIQPGHPQYFPISQIKEKISKIVAELDQFHKASRLYIQEKKLASLKYLIDMLKSEISPDLKAKKIDLHIEIPANIPRIKIDPIQFKMVLWNLARNSIEAISEKGGKISISVSKLDENVLIQWTDSGPGIPPENAPKIFDVFWTTKNKGYGLGLFHAKAIIEEHYGSISLDMNYKKGTRFLIELPLTQD